MTVGAYEEHLRATVDIYEYVEDLDFLFFSAVRVILRFHSVNTDSRIDGAGIEPTISYSEAYTVEKSIPAIVLWL